MLSYKLTLISTLDLDDEGGFDYIKKHYSHVIWMDNQI